MKRRGGGDSCICSDSGRNSNEGVKCVPCLPGLLIFGRVPSESVIGQRGTHQVAMKLLWVIATHGLLVSGRYIRERRETATETVEESRIQGKCASNRR